MSVLFKMPRWILRSARDKVTERMIEMLVWLAAGAPPNDLAGTDGALTGTEGFCLTTRPLCLLPSDGREARDLPLSLHRLARLRGPRVPGVFPELPLESARVRGAGGGARPRRGALQRGNRTLGDVFFGGHVRGPGRSLILAPAWTSLQICPFDLTSLRSSPSSWTRGKTRHRWTSEAFCWT